MTVSIEIPDELARDLVASGVDLSRSALEAFALREYEIGLLSRTAVQDLLGLKAPEDLDQFLRANNVTFDLLTLEDVERDAQDLACLQV